MAIPRAPNHGRFLLPIPLDSLIQPDTPLGVAKEVLLAAQRGDADQEASLGQRGGPGLALPRPAVVDSWPVLGYAKAKLLEKCDKKDEANQVWQWQACYSPIQSQWMSFKEVFRGNPNGATLRQRVFLDGVVGTLQQLPESVPVVGHIAAMAHSCAGNRVKAKRAGLKATRSCVVLGAGAAVVVPHSHAIVGGMKLAVATAQMIAAAAGCIAGCCFDGVVQLNRPEWYINRQLTVARVFDLAAIRLLDLIRGYCGFHCGLALLPDHISQITVYTTPLTAEQTVSMVSNGKLLSAMESNGQQLFVQLNTTKGHSILTERLSDGTIVVDSGSEMWSFLNGIIRRGGGNFDEHYLHLNADHAVWVSRKLDAKSYAHPVAEIMQVAASHSMIGNMDGSELSAGTYANEVYKHFTGMLLPRLHNGWNLDVAKVVAQPPSQLTSHMVWLFGSNLQTVIWQTLPYLVVGSFATDSEACENTRYQNQPLYEAWCVCTKSCWVFTAPRFESQVVGGILEVGDDCVIISPPKFVQNRIMVQVTGPPRQNNETEEGWVDIQALDFVPPQHGKSLTRLHLRRMDELRLRTASTADSVALEALEELRYDP